MKIGLIMFLLLLFSGIGQSEISEKEAVDRVRRIPASSIDAELSGSPFGNWFEQIVGPKAGVIWQLAECGEYSDQTDGKQRDLNACVEADAVLEDDLKVVVAINVGTFRKGMIGRPVLYLAIIECDNQLHDVRRLRDLSSTLQSLRRGSPVKAPLVLPSVSVRPLVIRQDIDLGQLPTLKIPLNRFSNDSGDSLTAGIDESPPKPPPVGEASAPPQPKRIDEGLLRGRAIVKAYPSTPTNVGPVSVFLRRVSVDVTISETGKVIEAKATSGHPKLRAAAIEAARQWVFEPATFNGRPVIVKSVLTFDFRFDSR